MDRWEDRIEQAWTSTPATIAVCGISLGVAMWTDWVVPSPGVAIGILGAAAAVMALRGDMRPREKAAWIAVVTLLLVGEIRSIAKNDTQVKEERKVQLRRLEDLNNGIQTSIKENDAKFHETLQGVHETLNAANTTLRQTQPHAVVRLGNFGFEPRPDKLQTGEIYKFNNSFTNVGAITAFDVYELVEVYLAKPDDMDAQKQLVEQFEKKWTDKYLQKRQKPEGLVLIPDKEHFSTTMKTLTREDIEGIRSQNLTIYYLIRFEYSDITGRWREDDCGSYQNVEGSGFNLGTQHTCFVFRRHRYAVGKR